MIELSYATFAIIITGLFVTTGASIWNFYICCGSSSSSTFSSNYSSTSREAASQTEVEHLREQVQELRLDAIKLRGRVNILEGSLDSGLHRLEGGLDTANSRIEWVQKDLRSARSLGRL